ncbi:MAG TPA: dockerin type I repeat-containing protein [Tepidisphaeraceae bacterium]|nr:dockerin type I repeat-containing protein [Tepidisphaeraceae bacterium]
MLKLTRYSALGVLIGALGSGVAVQAGQVIFQDNFESAPAVSNQPPDTSGDSAAEPVATIGTWWLKEKSADYSEQVTDYSPPGAEQGNNYLRLVDSTDSEAEAIFTSPQTGDFELSCWVYNVNQPGFRIFGQDSAGDDNAVLSWGEAVNGFLDASNGPGAGGFYSLGVPYSLNTWQHLIMDFHVGDGTFDVSLDGNTATGMPMTAFGNSPPTDISDILFAGGGGNQGMYFYIDDVTVTANSSVIFQDDFENVSNNTTPKWNLNASGDWNTAAHWNGPIPNGVDAVANFTDAITAPRTIYTDVPVTVGTLEFNNADEYLLTGLGTLTMDASNGQAAINVDQGSHEINLPLYFATDTTITTGDGATLTVADPAYLSSGVIVSVDGTGSLVDVSTLHASGPATIKVNGGTASFDAANNDPNLSINVDPGSVNFGANQQVSSLNMSLGGNTVNVGRTSAGAQVSASLTVGNLSATGGGTDTLQITGAGNTVDVTNTLHIDPATTLKRSGPGLLIAASLDNQGTLDLTNGDMIVTYIGASPAVAIGAQIATGYDHGAWDGAGITSSSVAADPNHAMALGYADNATLGLSTFDGQTIGPDSVLVKYTWLGDTNLDGVVNGTDISALLAGETGHLSGWQNGDLNYDGVVNSDDFSLLLLGAAEESAAPPPAPEPASLASSVVIALLLAKRRRR